MWMRPYPSRESSERVKGKPSRVMAVNPGASHPPKTERKKAVKGKSLVVDKRSTDERFKDQLEENIVGLRKELVREREERNYFQLERDKIQGCWEVSRRRLEEEKAELRSRQREREEAKDRHQEEITLYKQRLKHVLSEHHDSTYALKADAVASTVPVLIRHVQAELGLRSEVHGLQAERREKKLQGENVIMELKLKHQVELVELENHYEKRVTEMEMKYHNKVQLMITAHTTKLEQEVARIDGCMKSRVATLLEDHERAVRCIDPYYGAQTKVLFNQKNLKVELAEAMALKARTDKRCSKVEQENRRLKESLPGCQRKLSELQKQLQDHKQASIKTAATKARVKALDQEKRDLSVEHVLLEQAFEKVQQECDELSQKQTAAMLDIEQQCGLKHLLLERKVAALTHTLEKKEAQLCAALLASNIDQTAASSAANKLQEMLESKQATANGLQRDLDRDCTEYDDLLQTCKDQLKALGVPLHDFPFKCSKWILGGRTRVQNSQDVHE
ncbi:dynein regulatory complex subunit 4-like [Cyclopterus lumpus]|uniref:dynein regulatory complex subunit 4-like n=1 Tax=Cyclopterus lumpus TaxID=8103 RepID=UPI00148701AA|nr:dynein regulatory complex subunit 4-like [Cyclopterus lumpus]